MLVRDIMHSPVVSIGADARLDEAYARMQSYRIRHLPVLDGERLVGVVTDRDLRLATSALHPHPFQSGAEVREVMTREVVTAAPLEPVEEAARVMRDRKIGCLPVLEGERLAGIITGPDLLDALIELTGMSAPSGRLAVELGEAPGQLVRLIDAVDAAGAEILSVLSYPDRTQHPHVILRVDTLHTHMLADRLRAADFDVSWPPHKAW